MKKNFIFNDVNELKGVGAQLSKYLKRKKIEKIKDIILNLPYSETDRSKLYKLDELEIGKIQSIKVKVKKLNFPRIRNLPNKVSCEDETGKLDCIFFNSFEGYVKKILPLNTEVTVSGKVTRFKNKYQITNPKYISEDASIIKNKHNKYSLTEGISEKIYNKIINQILKNIPKLDEWHNQDILKKFDNSSWNDSIIELHKSENVGKYWTFQRHTSRQEALAPLVLGLQPVFDH